MDANWPSLHSGSTNWATAADGLTDTAFLPDSPTDVTFSVNLINGPFTATGGNQSPGQDYMVLGSGINFQFTPDFSMLLGYQVQLFRTSMSSHFASIRFGYKF